jgi:tetratricopeptide (TPR) repeat protein
MTVDEYLELLTEESSRVLGESKPFDYPVGVAAAWSMSMARLREQMPFAWELLRRLAYFGPEPIDRDLFKNGRYVLDPPLKDQISDPIVLGRATRELGRYALAKVDNFHKTLQVHRLIQRLIRDEIDADEAETIRHEVHLLLAAANPGDPDDVAHWPAYDELLAHIVPSEAVLCQHAEGRRLVRDMVRYLFNAGDLGTCDDISRVALDRWRADSGDDDPDVLIIAGHRANLLWTQGRYDAAYELRQPTMERMRQVLGDDHEQTLQVINDHGADLRARGDFAGALTLDTGTQAQLQRVLGDDHQQTLMVANNVAVDQGLTSDYTAAHETDTLAHQDRLDFFGRDDHPWVILSLAAIGRDLRQGGKYVEALATQTQAYDAFASLVRQRVLPSDHQWVLWQAKDLSVVRRKMGLLQEALDLAEEVYEKYVASYGPRHPDTLAASMNLGNARRVYGDVHRDDEQLTQADRDMQEALTSYSEVYGLSHPYTHGCALNLAIVRRRNGDVVTARTFLENARLGFQMALGDDHHFSLIALTELATSLSTTDAYEEARAAGDQALEGLRRIVGSDHPHSLACAANLALDLQTLGESEASNRILTDTVRRYRELLPPEHIDVEDAVSGKRIALDIEPTPL